MKIRISDRAYKQLKKIPKNQSERLLNAIDSLSENPRKGKRLTGKLAAYFSLRVGDYRIIYSISDDLIQIIVLGQRSHIYDLIQRLLNSLLGL